MIKVLHLPSWFPKKEQPFLGNFVVRHIESVAPLTHSTVLNVFFDEDFEYHKIIETQEKEINYLTLNLKRFQTKFSIFNKIFNKIRFNIGFNKLYKYYKKQNGKPDIIHLHVALPLGIIARNWSKKDKIPLVLTEHWTIYHRKFSGHILHQLRKIYAQTNLVLPVSQHLQKAIEQWKLHQKFEVIPNVIDTSIFKTVAKPESNIKSILHVSTLDDHQKNISGIINVIDKLSKIRQDFVLNIVHESKSQALEDLVSQKNLSEYIRFLGSKTQPEIAELMQNSSFFLLFSNYENLPCVLLESLACGLPVLSSDVGGISEIISSEYGILVPAQDEERLLEELIRMLDHFSEFDKIKMAEYVHNNFSYQIIGQKTLTIYEKI